jgi:hypothetical protein
MNQFVKNPLLGAMLLFSQMSVADSASASDNNVPITVTMTSSAKEQVRRLSASEKKRFKEAIKMANRFIPHHFDGSAYDNGDAGGEEELKKWQRNIRPLVDRDVHHWYTLAIEEEAVEQLKMDGLPGHSYAGDVAVCPQIELVSITVPNEQFHVPWRRSSETINFVEDDIELIYRVKVIGAWPGLGPDTLIFVPDKGDQWVSVLVGLDRNNRVHRIIHEYALTVGVPKRWVDVVSRYTNGVWAESSTTADKIRLRRMLEDMKGAESKVCVKASLTERSFG